MNTQNILVLAPHPDDESLGCGGTIKLLTEAGKNVDVAFMTRGENGIDVPTSIQDSIHSQLASTREAEARAACEVLGVRAVEFLKGSDGGLINQPHLAHSLIYLLNAGNYQRVFSPWQGEAHPDHVATFRWLQRAVADTGVLPSIWLYEIWTPFQPSDLVPIDLTIESKRAAILKHESQLACLDYLAAFMGLASYRALHCPPSKYAEGFMTLDTPTFLSLKAPATT
jgi:LmbE family N-acetylglucosaminyl deacetylase